MAGKFDLKTAKNGQYSFALKAGNGQIILQSELYKEKRAAEAGIESVRKNAASDKRFERKTAKDGSFYFSLTATNGQDIGRSEMYKTEAARDKGIESVKANAPEARVDDQTGS